MNGPTEDARKRAERDGRNWHQCGVCKRWFLIRGNYGSMLGPRITVCGVLLNSPEAHCLLTDDFGNWWWPKDKPLPDLLEID